jgi:hypothetical protein
MKIVVIVIVVGVSHYIYEVADTKFQMLCLEWYMLRAAGEKKMVVLPDHY